MQKRNIHESIKYVEMAYNGEKIDIEVLVEYTYIPGTPERGPSYSSGGEPADPPEVELQGVWLLNNLGKKVEEIELTDADQDRITRRIMENHEEPERE